jgi:hypothetical protein
LPPRPFDIGDAGVERLGDLAVAPAFTGVRNVGFNRMRAFVSNCAERLPEPINRASFSPPPLPLRRDSELPVKSNDAAY